MKNIYILPTHKPSRLGYLTKKGKEVYKDLRLFDRLMPNILDSENQHIYITSDEYIGLSYYLDGSLVSDDDKDYWEVRKDYKKIILTTDQDLIKDGVQAIDDEFLEWFVKNPSCEEVEFTSERRNWKEINYVIIYKIIIPKEEPKQETVTYSDALKKEERIFNSTIMFKQSTLEEAFEKWADQQFEKGIGYDKFDVLRFGAKWQQQNSYSKEEVLDILMSMPVDSHTNIIEWFNKFKNK